MEDQQEHDQAKTCKKGAGQKLHLFVLLLDLSGVIDGYPRGDPFEFFHSLLDLGNNCSCIGKSGFQAGIHSHHPFGILVLDGTESGGIPLTGYRCNGDLFYLPVGGIPEDDVLVEKRTGIVPKVLVKTDIDIIILPVLFIDPSLVPEQGTAELIPHLAYSNT